LDLDSSDIKEKGNFFFARADVVYKGTSRLAFLISVDDPEGRREADVSIYLVAGSVDADYDARLVHLGTRRIRLSRDLTFDQGTENGIVFVWYGFRMQQAADSNQQTTASACSEGAAWEAGGRSPSPSNKRNTAEPDEAPIMHVADQVKRLKTLIDEHVAETKQANFGLHDVCQIIFSTGYETQMRVDAILSVVKEDNRWLKEENSRLKAELRMYRQQTLYNQTDAMGIMQPISADGYHVQTNQYMNFTG
jgi:hypothetical protein